MSITHSDYCPVNDTSEEDCPVCLADRAREDSYWRKEYESHGRREMEQAKTYEQDMIDAGRGHLLESSMEAAMERAEMLAEDRI